MISLKNLGSVFTVVEGDRDMDLLVADIVFVQNWFNSRWGYFGFQLWVSKFFFSLMEMQDFVPLSLCCSHSRVIHKDHKVQPKLGIHWGKTSGDRTDRRPVLADREIQAEKDRIGSPIIENISHINLVRASTAQEYYT